MKYFHLPFLPLPVLILGWQLFATEAFALWSTNPTINNAICTDYYNQNQIQMISDGSGGAIITWVDYRFQPSYTIFTQRINSNGITQWTTDGIQVSSSSVNNLRPSITTDGQGGAIITWVTGGDFGTLYAQRINATGALLWPANGVMICSTTVSNQAIPSIASDGHGGGIIAWADSRNNVGIGDDDIFAQRVNADGAVRWAANGIAVIDTTRFQGGSLQVKSDGSGGAIMVWEDTRMVTTINIYTQKIDSNGVRKWATNGVLINSVTNGSLYPQLISDAGGAIICWVDRRNGNTDWNIYAQKVNASGSVQWTTNGEAICLASSNQDSPQLVSDGNGGAIITWNEPMTATNTDPNIYAQRIDASGTARWTTNGAGVCLDTNSQQFPQLAGDGNGGVVITWHDFRTNNIQNIYAQKVDSGGSSLWSNNGVAVSTATFVQVLPIIINDEVNGSIITWIDYRNDLSGNRSDIYAQRVNDNGTLGGATGVNENDLSLPTTFTLEQNYPNPFNPITTISFSIPEKSFVSLKVFDLIGREVTTIVFQEMNVGRYSRQWNANSMPSGVYFCHLQSGSFIETKKLLLLK